MDKRHLECFIRLSDNLNFAKTAEEMYIAQSTVTREIQNLENELGFKLFKRNAKMVYLTEEGYEFKTSIRPLLNSFNTTISRIKNKQSIYRNSLKMGFFHLASLKDIPLAINKFHKEFPYILPEIKQGNLNQLNSMFNLGQLDLIFAVRSIMKPKQNDGIFDLYQGEFKATVPIKHPLANYPFLTFKMINGFDILFLDKPASYICFDSFGHELRKYCPDSQFISCASTDEQEVYLKSGIGIAISTDYSFIENSSYKQIVIDEDVLKGLQTNYAVMYHKGQNENHVEDFIKILKDTFN